MPIYNWSGGREVSHTTAKGYQDKVIELMELEGHILIKKSSDVSMTPDLIFRKPETEGNTDIYVETKFADVSLSDKDFLSELARYFILYTSNKEPFDFHMYIRKLKNLSKWKQIFSAHLYDEKTCKAFFESMSTNDQLDAETQMKIQEEGFDAFRKFITDTYVNQMDYQILLMKIEEKKKGKTNLTYGYDYYLRELTPLKQKQQIVGNFSEITKYKGQIYCWELYQNVRYGDIYDAIERYQPIHPKKRYLYSLDSNLPEKAKQLVRENTLKTFNPDDWLLEGLILEGSDKLSLLQILYKKYLLNYGVSKDCKYVRYRSADLLFFAHMDYSKELTKVDNKQVTRLFSETKSPFVKHEAIEIEVKIYSQRLFVFFTPTVLFTDKDKNLITGIGAKTLHDMFSPNKHDNNTSILGDMRWWSNYLCDKKSLLETTKLSSFTGSFSPPQDSQERNDIASTQLMEKYF